MAEPVFVDDNNLQLNFAFAFHQKRINDGATKQLISKLLMDITGTVIDIDCVNIKDGEKPKPTPAKPTIVKKMNQ